MTVDNMIVQTWQEGIISVTLKLQKAGVIFISSHGTATQHYKTLRPNFHTILTNLYHEHQTTKQQVHPVSG